MIIDTTDPDSVYRRIQALRTDAQNKRNTAISNYNNAFVVSTNFTTRNTMLKIGRSFQAPYIDPYGWIAGYIYYGVGDFPVQPGGANTFKITRDGYYMFVLNLTVNGANATLKILSTGSVIETIKLSEFQDVSDFAEFVACGVSVTKYLKGGSYIGFSVETDASAPTLGEFRGFIRRL